MKKGLIFLSLFIVCFLGVLIIAPGFIDWNRHKPTIISQLENTTGHQYEIEGPLEFTILPFPKLLIGGLEISSGDEKLLTLGRLDVQVDLLPLIQGDIIVKDVSLIDPVIRLGINRNGQMSWMTPLLEEKLSGNAESGNTAEGQKSASDMVRLESINVRNGTFIYSDARSDTQETITGIDLALAAESLIGPFEIAGAVIVREQEVEFDIEAGRFEKDADNISVNGEITVPAAATAINYSGIVGTKGIPELQGEAALDSKNLNTLLTGFKIGDVPALAKPVKTSGMFSYNESGASYRNLSMTFDGQSLAGFISFKPAAGEIPAQLETELSGEKLDLARILPEAQKQQTAAPLKSFIPQSMTLPMAVNVSAALTAQSVSYNKLVLSGVSTQLSKEGAKITLNAGGNLGEGQAVKLDVDLSFGATSVSENTGAVTYSDPVLSYNANMAVNAAQPLAGLLPSETLEALRPYLGKGLRTTLSGNVTPLRATVVGGTANINDTALEYSGSYTLSSVRDAIIVNLQAADINIDHWMPAGEEKNAGGKVNISQYTKMLDLPFDLSLTAISDSVTFGGQKYRDLQVKTALNGKQLKIDNAGLSDSDGNNFLVTGTIADVVALENVNLSVSGKTTDLETLLKSFDVDASRLPTRVGAAELVSEFRGQPDNLTFTANVKALNGVIETSGSLKNMLETPAVSGLTLRLRHPNYVEFARLFMPKFESGVGVKKSLDLFASMENNAGIYSFSEIKALIGPSTITGSATIDASGAKPAVKLIMQADELPLDAFMGHSSASKGTTRITPTTSQTNTPRWSRDPIDVSWMDAMDLDLQASANSLSYGNWIVTKAKLDTVLNGGTLSLQEISGGIYEGALTMQGEVAQSSDPRAPIVINGKTTIENVQLEPFVQSFSGSKLVRARGPVSMNTTFSSKGLSQSDLVSNIQGTGGTSGQNLVFEGFDLARLSRALAEPSSSFSQNFGRILDASTSGGTTNFDTLDGAFDIQNGVININTLTLAGPEATVTGSGNVNLPLWTIDLTTNVNLVEPADAPALKTVFKGPLDSPASTFGQNVMNQYFNKQLEGLVVNPLMESLQKKGILPSAPQKQAPSSESQTEIITPEGTSSGEAANDNTAPQQQQELKPEDAIKGILRGVLSR